MFNYNSLANVDNNTCIPFIFGCTDPSALNFNSQANSEDFSCIDFYYGCTDSIAFNFDPLANTDNGSCVAVVEGCMDQSAYNYTIEANVNDSASCLYSADCITGPGNPYWLNDPCYEWVTDVDSYCCDNEWDTICQATYDYCDGSWVGPLPPARMEVDEILIYPNPADNVLNISRKVDIKIYNMLGEMVVNRDNISILYIGELNSGVYTIILDKLIIKRLIKK
jgi:hypothetical protein